MAITGSLGFTWDSPVNIEGLMVQAESRVKLGKNSLYGSLEVTSPAYTSYGASLGMRAGTFHELGLLSELSMEQTPTYEQVESANARQSGIYILTEEEMNVTVGIYQFNVDILRVAFGTGNIYRYNSDQEVVMTVGDGCAQNSRPLQIETTNIHCGAANAAVGVDTRIRAIVITIYDAITTSGVPWSDINAGALNPIVLTFQARSVLANDRGNRFASVYVV